MIPSTNQTRPFRLNTLKHYIILLLLLCYTCVCVFACMLVCGRTTDTFVRQKKVVDRVGGETERLRSRERERET